ncbi:photosystem II stability/assembly factor-like protein, partial [Duganella sp. FT80W]|nr:photosystem II stability/assembly factor-like protein [Duganella guangzhouensis]
MAVVRSGSRLVAAGERGLIIYSDDSGQHWSQAQVPVSVTLTALRFANEREGWAVGNMGVVLRSSDGGQSWKRVFDGKQAAELAEQAAQQAWDAVKPDPNNPDHPLNLLLSDAQRLVDEGADKPFLDLCLQGDGSALVVGAYGLAFSTADGGKSWQALMKNLPNPNGATYYGIAERQQEQYLFGEQGVLLRATGTTGADAAFSAQTSPASGSLFGGLATRQGTLMLYGLRGKVYRSAQPGAAWTEVQTPVDASLIAGLQLADDTVLLLGSAGQIVASRDQGQSFTALPLKTRFPFTGATVAPDGTLIVTGTRGLLRLPAASLTAAAPAKATPSTTATHSAPAAVAPDDAARNSAAGAA